MALLVELTNLKTGARQTLFDEADGPLPRRYYGDVLDPSFYFGTVMVKYFEAKPGTKRQMFFDVFVAQCGGTWKQVRENLWLHVERK